MRRRPGSRALAPRNGPRAPLKIRRSSATRGGVVARHESGDLRDPGGAGVGKQLRRQSGADPALLVARRPPRRRSRRCAVTDETGDRDRSRVASDVRDEHVSWSASTGAEPLELHRRPSRGLAPWKRVRRDRSPRRSNTAQTVATSPPPQRPRRTGPARAWARGLCVCIDRSGLTASPAPRAARARRCTPASSVRVAVTTAIH